MPSYTADKNKQPALRQALLAELAKGEADTIQLAKRLGAFTWEVGNCLGRMAKAGDVERRGLAQDHSGRTSPPMRWAIRVKAVA